MGFKHVFTESVVTEGGGVRRGPVLLFLFKKTNYIPEIIKNIYLTGLRFRLQLIQGIFCFEIISPSPPPMFLVCSP